jgi:hypothetical protein
MAWCRNLQPVADLFAYRVWHGHEHDFWWMECALAPLLLFNIVIRLWPRGHIQA